MQRVKIIFSGEMACFLQTGDKFIRVEANISNVGEYDSAQTLQIYVSTGLKDAPKAQLKGLKKAAVKKNETKHVEITLTDKAFALYNEDGEMVLTKGSCKIYVPEFRAGMDA